MSLLRQIPGVLLLLVAASVSGVSSVQAESSKPLKGRTSEASTLQPAAVQVVKQPLVPPAGAASQIPQQLRYQGVLTDPTNAPLTGAYALTFRLYATPVGGAPLWTETQADVPVDDGLFGVLLGSLTSLALPFDQPYWLSIEVGTDGEMTPRQPLASVPTARRADVADAITPGALTPVYIVGNNVGIGTATPAQTLDVAGTVQATGFKMPTGAVIGTVLTSDANGVGAWQPLSGATKVPGALHWEMGKLLGVTATALVTFTTPFSQPPIVVAGIGNTTSEVQVSTFDANPSVVWFTRQPSGFPTDICWLAIDRAAFTIDNEPGPDVRVETFRGWTTGNQTTMAFQPVRNIEPAIALLLTDSEAQETGGHLLVSGGSAGPRPGRGFAYRQNGGAPWGAFAMALLLEGGSGQFGSGIPYEAGYVASPGVGAARALTFTNTYTDPLIFLTPALRVQFDTTPTASAWYANLTPTGVDIYTNVNTNHVIFYLVMERQSGARLTNGWHQLRVGE